jgi:hypothetical protein
MTPWFCDQSRYICGFECPWRRLIRYHMMGTGLTFQTILEDIRIGSEVHGHIEQAYAKAQRGEVTGRETSKEFFGELELQDNAQITTATALTVLRIPPIVVGLVNAYLRVVLPWVVENYDILATEEEYSHDLGDGIIYMARPDLSLREKSTGLTCVADYKTSSSKPDRIAQIHIASLQTSMNGWSISQRHGKLGSAQIHVLNRGSEDWPSFLTHAYYRPGQPPYIQEDWQPKSRKKDGSWLGKLYKKVEVVKFRPISDWVWSMDPTQLSEAVPVLSKEIDPDIQGLKVLEAIGSIRENEKQWRDKTSQIDWDHITFTELDLKFPRTFKCVQYNRTCEYEGVCFHRKTLSLEKPRDLLAVDGSDRMIPRTPHHPQEGNLED